MFLEQVTKEQKQTGLRVMIYGEPKVGKSYFGAQIPNHVFLNLENGLEHLNGANKLPYTESYEEVKAMLKELATVDHPYKTLVVDSADVLENLIKKWIVGLQNNTNIRDIADIAFGRGYPLLLTETRKLIEKFEYLRTKKGMNIIFICHSEVKKMQPPVGNEYTYIAPSLYAKTTQGDSTLKIYSDYVDIIGYCTFKTIVQTQSTGFGSRGQAIGTGERVLHLDASNPAYIAGSRYPMPAQIPFSWESFITNLTGKEPTKEKATEIPTEE
ncbi:MAG: ATP-binding protein [Bacteroidales bacterium]|nr:ATP-binding protein [Bacteroidales bacterium]